MKLLKRLVIVLGAILVVGAGAGILFVDLLARQAVERSGSYALGVPTTLEQASIGLFSGRFSLGGLRIANPPGCTGADFLTLRQAQLEMPLSALGAQRITIPAFEVEGIVLSLERGAGGTNYGAILENLRRFEAGEQVPVGDSEPGGKTFLLQRLVIRDVRATADLLPQGGDLTRLSLAIPEIVVEGITSEMTAAELCVFLVKTVIDATLRQGAGVLPEELLRDVRGRLEGLKGGAAARINARFEEGRNKAEQALESAGVKAGERLDALLKGNEKD